MSARRDAPSLKLVAIAATLLVALGTTAPAAELAIRYGGPLADGRQQWRVVLLPESASAVAVEIGLQFVGGSILAATPNAAVFDDLNPGQNPFVGGVTEGVSIHDAQGSADAAFAALGGLLPDARETLVLTLTTDGIGTLSLGGQDHNGLYVGARVAQNKVNRDGLVAARTVTGLEGDFDQNGAVGSSDLPLWGAQFGGSGGPASGDADGDGRVEGRDLLIWQAQFGAAAAVGLSGAAIPEPSAASLCLAALPALGRKRARTTTALR